MKKRTKLAALGLVLASLSASSQAYIYSDAGTAESKTRFATRHDTLDSAKQHRNQQGWMYADSTQNNAVSGFYQAANYFKLHDQAMRIGVGSVNMKFNPAELDCTQGMSFELEVGDDTVTTIEPNCDDLLNASVTYPVSHTFDLLEAPAVLVPMDPLGLMHVGVKFGVGVTVGADFTVGGVIGGYDNDQPFEPNGVRNPDYVYAQVEPYVGGKVSGSAYTSLGWGISELGVKGKFNLIKVKGKGYMEAGIRRVAKEQDIIEEGFVELKISGKVSGGDGSIAAYCKKLWGLLKFEQDLVKWGPLYEYEQTFFEYASPSWEAL